jgi:hypothetical protein
MSLLLDLTRAKEFAQEPEQLQQLLVTFEHSLAQELLELDAAFAHAARPQRLFAHVHGGLLRLIRDQFICPI